MATFQNFPGKSQGWLETELGKVLDDLASGKTVVSSGAGDSNLTERSEVSIVRRRDMILSDLSVLDPGTYPRTEVIGARRTRPRY